MTDVVDELLGEAQQAVTAMREAALRARALHARAELMRHMRTTAAKSKDKPRAEAVRAVVDEWLDAWALTRESWPHVAEMEAVTIAFHDHARAPSFMTDGALRTAILALDAAFAKAGKPLADQMAWRSMCAHGWWGQVTPPPPGQGRADRQWPARPFWEDGCLPQCL